MNKGGDIQIGFGRSCLRSSDPYVGHDLFNYKTDNIPVQLTFAVSRNGTLIYGGYSMFDVEYENEFTKSTPSRYIIMELLKES